MPPEQNIAILSPELVSYLRRQCPEVFTTPRLPTSQEVHALGWSPGAVWYHDGVLHVWTSDQLWVPITGVVRDPAPPPTLDDDAVRGVRQL